MVDLISYEIVSLKPKLEMEELVPGKCKFKLSIDTFSLLTYLQVAWLAR